VLNTATTMKKNLKEADVFPDAENDVLLFFLFCCLPFAVNKDFQNDYRRDLRVVGRSIELLC